MLSLDRLTALPIDYIDAVSRDDQNGNQRNAHACMHTLRGPFFYFRSLRLLFVKAPEGPIGIKDVGPARASGRVCWILDFGCWM